MSTSVTWYDGVTYSVPASGEINWPALSNLLIALGTKAAITTISTQAIRVATSTPVTVVASTDCTVVTNLGVAGAVAVNLPAGVDGRQITIVDGKGDAATNAITINRNGSTDTINGLTSLVIGKPRQAVTLQYHAASTDWKVIASYFPAGTVTPADFTGVLPPDKGGTGVANPAAATTTRSGAFSKAETLTANTAITYPVTGTLATLAGAETLTNKTLTAPALQQPVQASYEDFTDISTPAAPAAGITRLYTKAGIPYKLTSTLPETPLGGGTGSGSKNYLSKSTSTAAGWASTGTATATTDTTAADLPEPSVGTGILFTLGTAGNYSFVRWTVDPNNYSVKSSFTAAVKALTGYVGGNAKIDIYSNTTANYSGTSTRIPLTTDVSGVSAVSTAQNFATNYDNPTATAPYMEARLVTVTAAGTLVMSSVSTGPGSTIQGANVGPEISYVPILNSAWGTSPPIQECVYAMLGGNRIMIRGSIAPGTSPTGSALLVYLPNGWTAAQAAQTPIGPALSTNGSDLTRAAIMTASGANFGFNASTNWSAAQLTGTAAAGGYVQFEVVVSISQLIGSGTVNLAQNDVQYLSSTNGTWDAPAAGTNAVIGPQGSPITGSLTAPRVKLINLPGPLMGGATPKLQYHVTGGDANSWVYAENSQWPFTNLPSIATSGYVNMTSSTQIAVIFQQYATPGSSYNATPGGNYSATLYDAWRVVIGSPGQAVGFGAVVPPSAGSAGSSGLVPAAGLPGRTDGNAVPTNCIGETQSFTFGPVTWGGSSLTTNVGSFTVPAGVWKFTGKVTFATVSGTSLNGNGACHAGLSVNNSSIANAQLLKIHNNTFGGQINNQDYTLPEMNVSISTPTTYFINEIVQYSGTGGQTQAYVYATRIG